MRVVARIQPMVHLHPPRPCTSDASHRAIRHLKPTRKLHITRGVPQEFDEGVYRDAEESAQLLDKLIRDVARTSLVEAATDYVTGDEHQGNAVRRETIKEEVGKILGDMNDTFLPTLMGYMEAISARVEEDPSVGVLLGLMEDIRSEILLQLSDKLPPNMQIMNKLLTAPSSTTRLSLLEHHISPEATPHCPLDTLLENTVSMILDMERMPQVPDSRLLARLCLLREEMIEIKQEQVSGLPTDRNTTTDKNTSSNDDTEADYIIDTAATERMQELLASMQKKTNPLSQALPAYTLSFMKNLMAVGRSENRRALLLDAFKQGMGVDMSPEEAYKQAQSGVQPEDIVRPGRFVDCLNLVQQELLSCVESGRMEVDENVLVRLEDVRRDALGVLVDLSGEDIGYSP